MRINEIITESEVLDEITRPNSIENAAEVLRNAGYEKIGYGAFAEVYVKSGEDHVLKLFASFDNAYRAFANMTVQNPNVHFPTFKGKLMKVTDQYYAIRMEKLTPISEDYEPKMTIIKNYMLERWSRHSSYKPDPDYPSTVEHDMELIETQQPGITEACDLIVHLAKTNYFAIDFHANNGMMRGNVLVITDPVI